MIEFPRRLRGVASSIGFSQATVVKLGSDDTRLAFNVPERPPVTYPPEEPTTLPLTLVPGTDAPDEVTMYRLDETVVRFPLVRQEDYPIATVRIAATVALGGTPNYPSGSLRIDQSNSGYTVEYSISRSEMRDIEPKKFLRSTYTVRNDFHKELVDVY